MGKKLVLDPKDICEGDWMIEAANESQEVKDIRETLVTYVRTIVPEYSVCLVQCPEDKIEEIAKSLETLNHNLLHMRIVFVACPIDMKITVIPCKSEVTFDDAASQAG